MPNLAVIVICMFVGILSAAMMSSPGPGTEETRYNVFFPLVPEIMPDDDYIVQNLDSHSKHFGERQLWRFCKDIGGQSVVFDEGELLLSLTFREYGWCKKVIHYTFERNPLNHNYVTRR